MGTCRVVIEALAHQGAWNMALDEALLEAAIEHGQCTVRWYRWQAATVSLGYFQASQAAAIPELAGLPIVRRLSGGGAILHHHEWTYSCAVPAGHPLAANPARIYVLVHEKIVAALAARGVAANLRGEAHADREGEFLCFGRGDPRDVVLEGHKIVGSAQRRRRGAVLQHGSLLLHRSEYAPQFPGLWDLRPAAAIDAAFIDEVAEETGAAMGTVEISQTHCPSVETRARALETRYRSLDWGRSRSAGP